MKKIKILRIITRLNIGGPAIHTALLTKELNNDEFESILVYGRVSKGEGDMKYLLEHYDVKATYLPSLKREIDPLHDMIAFYRIFKFIKQYKPDIVHTHTAKAGTLGRIAAILANVPVKIHTFHGNIFHGYFSKRNAQFFIFIEKLLAKFTDSIIAISDKQKEEFIKVYKITTSDKCRVINLGFDLQKFLDSHHKKDIFRRKFNFKEDDVLIGTVGRLTAIKNHKMFIDAVEYIHKNADKDLIDKLKFTIVGDGELKDELLTYSRLKGVGEKIFFTGWVKDIEEVYAGLDVAALTSINEGTPVSLIEAMASSTPVVSTDVGGVKDAVGEIGVLVRDGDYKTMGDKILELAASVEKRRGLGEGGRDFIKKRFSKERLVSELNELYKNLIMRRKA